MFEPIENLPNGVIGFRARGRVTGDDYTTTLVPAIERATAEGHKIRLLLELGEGFDGYDMSGMFADAGFGMGHLGSFEKMALVTDDHSITSAINLFGPLVPAAIRVFPVADRESARGWVSS